MATIVENKDGWERLIKFIGSSHRAVDVGLLPDKAALQKVDEDGEGGEKTLLEVALENEFGTETVPERSFIREWVDLNFSKIKKQMLKEVQAAWLRGDPNMDMALQRLGIWAQAEIQKRIQNRIPPPNAPATIAKKGSDVPLIDTGQLISAISWKLSREGINT